jgi:hypothetical protein
MHVIRKQTVTNCIFMSSLSVNFSVHVAKDLPYILLGNHLSAIACNLKQLSAANSYFLFVIR